jgi:hypothetical protein
MTITAILRRKVAAILVLVMVLPQTLWAQSAVDESPSAGAMVGDLVVARPIGAVLTVAGTAAWVVSLPFTLLAGHASEAAETLILGPGEATFMRCLGCRNPGYTGKDRAAIEARNSDDD